MGTGVAHGETLPEPPAPATLLAAYARGWFPMAESGLPDAAIAYYESDPRAVIPLDGLRVPRSVRRAAGRRDHEIRIDTAFAEVMRACADRPEPNWLNAPLIAAYEGLHAAGHAHSVECWCEGRLAGGLFGVALGGLFTSESMFHRVPDAGNLVLAETGRRLVTGGFRLWDIQLASAHTRRFGAVEVGADRYRVLLAEALRVDGVLA